MSSMAGKLAWDTGADTEAQEEAEDAREGADVGAEDALALADADAFGLSVVGCSDSAARSVSIALLLLSLSVPAWLIEFAVVRYVSDCITRGGSAVQCSEWDGPSRAIRTSAMVGPSPSLAGLLLEGAALGAVVSTGGGAFRCVPCPCDGLASQGALRAPVA